SQPVAINTPLDIRILAVDDSGGVVIGATVAGIPVALAPGEGGLFTGETLLTKPGTNEVIVTARDRSGNVTTSRCQIQVGDEAPPGAAPVVEFLSPTNTQVITGPIDIVGTAFDPTLASYRLSLHSVDGDEIRELGRGSMSVSNGTLGKL